MYDLCDFNSLKVIHSVVTSVINCVCHICKQDLKRRVDEQAKQISSVDKKLRWQGEDGGGRESQLHYSATQLHIHIIQSFLFIYDLYFIISLLIVK